MHCSPALYPAPQKLSATGLVGVFDAGSTAAELVRDLVKSFRSGLGSRLSSLQTSFTGAQLNPVLTHGTHRYRFSIDLYSVKVRP